MAGANVTRNDLDYAISQAVIDIRQAFRKVDSIATFLNNHPANDNPDLDLLKAPLPNAGTPDATGTGFGYTDDEAYLIRIVFEQLSALRTNALPTLDLGRKLTGLN